MHACIYLKRFPCITEVRSADHHGALHSLTCYLGAAIVAPKHNLGRQDRKMDTERFFAALVNDAAAAVFELSTGKR